MAYLKDKPDAGKSPKLDAPIIQSNFADFATAFATNHEALNSIHQGNHKNVIFKLQTTDPVVEDSFDTIYSKNAISKVSTEPQLFIRIPKFLAASTSSNTPMQLTYNKVNITGAGGLYQSFIAGGYIVYFGKGFTAIGTPLTMSPAPTKLLMAIATVNNFDTVTQPGFPFTVGTRILTTSQFQIFSNATAGTPFSWFAIGSV